MAPARQALITRGDPQRCQLRWYGLRSLGAQPYFPKLKHLGQKQWEQPKGCTQFRQRAFSLSLSGGWGPGWDIVLLRGMSPSQGTGVLAGGRHGSQSKQSCWWMV